MNMKSAARKADSHICPQTTTNHTPHVGGIITSGSGNIFINNKPAARVTDITTCADNSIGAITSGSNVVTFNGKPAARKTSLTTHGGVITAGSSNVFISNTGNPVIFGDNGIITIGNHGKIFLGGATINSTPEKPILAEYQTTLTRLRKNSLIQPHLGTLIIKFITDYDEYTKKSPATNIEQTDLVITYTDDKQRPKAITQKLSQAKITIKHFDLTQNFLLQTQQLLIAINNHPIKPNPEIIVSGLTNAEISNLKSITQNTRTIYITVLSSPVIINLRDKQTNNKILTATQLNYFKKKGNNATIFIHGFNIPTGKYAQYKLANQLAQEMSVLPRNSLYEFNSTTKLDTKQLYATICQHKNLTYPIANLAKNIPHNITPYLNPLHITPIKIVGISFILKLNNYTDYLEEIANGTGAYNWFNHMEDNLNRATNQFNGTDYRTFTRLINISWPGNPNLPINYMEAINNATKLGIQLLPLIKQLENANITINIFAHSAGNVLLLKLLDLLGKQNRSSISHAFLWEPAVPNSALANSPLNNKHDRAMYYYPNAHKAATKFIILYSKCDNILGSKICNVIDTYRTMQAKLMDPTAGFEIALTIGIINCIDAFNPPNRFNSVYNLANMFEKPFSYFLNSPQHCETFYQQWIAPQRNHQYRRNGEICSFISDFYLQIKTVKYDYPKLFAQLYIMFLTVKQGNMNNVWPLQKQLIRDFLKERRLKKTSQAYTNQAENTELHTSVKQAARTANWDEISTTTFIAMLNETATQIADLYHKEADNFRHQITKNLTDQIICCIVTIVISVLVSTNVKVAPAMGYAGPDEATKKLLHNKLQLVPQQDKYQHELLNSHSAMKMPTIQLMKKVYQQDIWRQNQEFKFGNYSH